MVHADFGCQEEPGERMALAVRPKEFPKRTEGRREKSTSICKEYLRNDCSRGARCKFVHPPNFEWKKRQVCYDFTVGKCKKTREKCHYCHGSREGYLKEKMSEGR